jgi:adenylosuccinate synthase
MSVDAIIGLQRGDEGKGRFVDLAADSYDVIARGNGGANAGHTIVPEGMEPIALHQVPSGIAYNGKLNIIGNGVYVDPARLATEIQELRSAGAEVSENNLLISDIAHLVFPHHVVRDEIRESGRDSQGSTRIGIAYVASAKFLREGVRVESINDPGLLFDLALAGLVRVNDFYKKSHNELRADARAWVDSTEALKPYVANTVDVINDRIDAGDRVLAEGAQAFWLDVNHGMYPYVTSSSTTVSGLLDGLGIAPKHLNRVTGVAKVIKSHVGGGPMVTEITDEHLAEQVRGVRGEVDSEYGATTKRPRKVGYPDLVELRNAVRVNGVDELVLSKMDHVPRFGSRFSVAVAYDHDGNRRTTAPSSARLLEACKPIYRDLPSWGDISDVRDFDELPTEARQFVELVEKELIVYIGKIGVGPKRNQVIVRCSN